MAQDYYELMGVSRTATLDEVKKAYRKLAMKYHPDRNQGDKASEKKFKEINEAYEVLKDDQKRAAYDKFGHAAFQNGGGGGAGPGFGGFGGFGGGSQAGFEDISEIFGGMFNDFMGGGRGRSPQPDNNRGSDLRYNMELSLEEAYHGGKHQIKFKAPVECGTCKGSGSKTGKTVKCNTCNGNGRVRMQQGFFMVERTCSTCNGTGEKIADPCDKCHGQGRIQQQRTLNVNIPQGVEDEMRIKVAGEGEAGARGGKPGDLYVFITIKKHRLFTREGANLHCSVPIRMTTAALGGSIEVPAIDGSRIKLSIAEGNQNGTQYRLKGKGMPVIKSGGRFGDLIVHTNIEVPVKLTKKQKDLLKQVDEELDLNSTPESESFFKKVKNFFEDLK